MPKYLKTILITSSLFLSLLVSSTAMAVEEAKYTVIRSDGDMELRDYEPSIVAETRVEGDFEDASGEAFRTLFRYIDGQNEARDKIAMTAPVSQKQGAQKIAMTAPVSQEASAEGWLISFMMPSSFTMDTIPVPLDDAVNIRQLPAYRAAAIRYSGFWSEKNYERHLAELMEWIETQNLRVTGSPVWARYNAPFTPWFMRRNEILVPVDTASP